VYENVNYKSISLPLATASVPGIVRAGNGIAVPTPGLFEVYGLLHGVPGSGRILTSGDNLNNGALTSGEYSYGSGGTAFPANTPPLVTTGGRIRISNFQGYIVQQVFPIPVTTGNEDPTDPNNQTWWRIGYNSLVFTAWRSAVPPSGGGNPVFTSQGTINNSSFSMNTTRMTTISVMLRSGSSHVYCYLNGTQVAIDDGEGGGNICYTAPPGVNLMVRHDGNSFNCPVYTLEWNP